MKRLLCFLLCLALGLGLFAGCHSDDPATEPAPSLPPVEATKPIIPAVRVLLFQPELEDGWRALAADYTAATGVPVTVVVSDQKNWEQTLHGQLEEDDAPSLFQMPPPTGTGDWASHCYNLTRTDAADVLESTNYALKDNGTILGLPLGIDAWGIWVNLQLLEKTGFRLEDITSQEALKTVANAVTADEEALGFSAFPGGELTRETLLALAATAISLEFKENNLKNPSDFQGRTLEGLHGLLALMGQGSSASDPRDAFLTGKALFFFGSYRDLEAFSGTLAPENLALIPAFLDETEVSDAEEETAPTEETQPEETVPEETEPEEPDPQGLCIGAEFFLCVNTQAPAHDLDVTLDFVDHLLATEEGAAALAKLGYILPYTTGPEQDRDLLPALNSKDILPRRDWAMPSGQWKTALLKAMTDYTAEPTVNHWNRLVDVFAGYWAAEYALTAES